MLPKTKLSKNAGVTLIELMVTLSVLAILAAISAPSIQNTLKNNRMVSQTNELNALVALARSEALRRASESEPVSMVLTPGTNSWRAAVLEPSGTAPGAVDCGADGVLRCGSFENVTLSFCEGDGCPDNLVFNFNNRGYLTPFQQVSMVLEHNNCTGDRQKRIIEIRPTGQIEVCSIGCGATTCP